MLWKENFRNWKETNFFSENRTRAAPYCKFSRVLVGTTPKTGQEFYFKCMKNFPRAVAGILKLCIIIPMNLGG